MPRKTALVDFNKCQPEACRGGVCLAAAACPRKLLIQESAASAPMTNPALCRGCGDCVRACPLKAIAITIS